MPDKKIITFVSGKITRGDGQGRVNYELAKSAIEHGYHVNIITTEADQDLIDCGANFIKVKKIGLPDLLFGSYFAFCANHLIDTLNSPGIIIANGYSTTRKHQINIAHFVHHDWLNSKYYLPKLNLFRPKTWYYNLYTRANCWWEKISFSRASTIVAVSDMIKEQLVVSGINQDKITTIFNGVDCSEFYPSMERRTNKHIGLVFIGDLKSSRKNLETVLCAIKSLPSVRLSVVGNTNGSKYPGLVKKMGLLAKVNFLGYRKNIAEILRNNDIFVFPSRYDPCPLVVMEALASGLITITSKNVGNWSLVLQSGTNILDNPEDTLSLESSLKGIIGNNKIRRECQAKSRQIALDFNWPIVTKKYFDLIKTYD